MKHLDVFYEGWGESWLLGRLAHAGPHLLFEYSPEALRQGLELSPRCLPLQSTAFSGFEKHQWYLPGLIADSMPDGWGLLLMDKMFRKNAVDTQNLSPLDRLAFIGDHAIGALSFKPSTMMELEAKDLDLLQLAYESHKILESQDSDELKTLARLGGSPQGARPKVLLEVAIDTAGTVNYSTRPFTGSRPWLVKFPAENEHPEVCAIEECYAALARDFQIDMPNTCLIEMDHQFSAFGTERFDREQGMRVPVLSMAGALDLNFSLPSVSYDALLKLTRIMTRNQAEVDKAYRRVVFNVAFHNRDDHTKNFGFRLNRQRHWELSPGYDLTFNNGPGGEHSLDICGEGKDINRSHMLKLAKEGGVSASVAASALDEAIALGSTIEQRMAHYPIRIATSCEITKLIQGCCDALKS